MPKVQALVASCWVNIFADNKGVESKGEFDWQFSVWPEYGQGAVGER